jgi:pimeloyl-ACP methyl ester carboxylesterase
VTSLHHARHPGLAPTPGPTFVLLHGWACAATDWDLLVPAFRRHGDVVTVDLPGSGGSAPSAEGYAVPTVARRVVDVLDHLGTHAPAVVVGHSAGSEVGVAVAESHPSVAALVAVEPAYGFADKDRDRIRAVARRLAEEDPHAVALEYFHKLDGPATPPRVTAAHSHRGVVDPDAIRGVFHDFAFGPGSLHFRPDTDDRHRARRGPLLALYRNQQRAASGRDFAVHDGDRVVIHEGAGHWLHHEDPDRFLAELLGWLRQVGVPA